MTEKLIDGEVSIKTDDAVENIKKVGKEAEKAAKEAEKATQKAAKEVEKAAQQAAKAAEKAAKDAADKLKEMAAKSKELFAKGIGGGELAEKVKSIGEGFKIAGDKSADMATRFRAGAGAAGILARGVADAAERLVQFAQDVVEANARLDEHQRQIGALGGAYNSTLAVADQLTIRQGALAQNIFLTDQQTAQLNQSMRDFAVTHMGSATEAASRFQQAVQSADNGALAQFGVHLDATVPAAQRMQNALAQLAHQQEGHPAIPPTETENARAWTEQLNHARDTLTSLFDPMSRERHEADENARAITRANQLRSEHTQRLLANKNAYEQGYAALQNINRILADQHAQALQNAKNLLDSITRSVTDYTTQLNRASNASQRFAFSADMGAEQNASRVMGAQQMLANMRAQRDSDRTVAHELRASGASHAQLVALGLEQQGQAGTPVAQLKRGVSEAINEIGRLGGTWEVIQRQRGESEESFWRRYEEHAQGALAHAREELEITLSIEQHHRALLDILRQEKDAKDEDLHGSKEGIAGRQDAQSRNGTYYARRGNGSDYNDPDSEQMQSMREASDASAQMRDAFVNNSEVMGTAAQKLSSGVSGAFQSLTGSFKAHLGALIEGRETAGQALQGILHETLTAIATESAVKALFEGAAAIASVAAQQYPMAAAHASAAAAYAAVAVATGVGAYVTTPHNATPAASAGSGAGGGTGRSVGTGPSSSGNDRGATYVINVNGTLVDREGFGNAVYGAMRDLRQRGVIGRAA